eukprot:6195318-Pleurochrysis_carterae.AAC.3
MFQHLTQLDIKDLEIYNMDTYILRPVDDSTHGAGSRRSRRGSARRCAACRVVCCARCAQHGARAPGDCRPCCVRASLPCRRNRPHTSAGWGPAQEEGARQYSGGARASAQCLLVWPHLVAALSAS